MRVVGLLSLLLLTACRPDPSGIVVRVSTDMTPEELPEVRLRVFNAKGVAVHDTTYAIGDLPPRVRLPHVVGFEPKDDGTSAITIEATGFRPEDGGAPSVTRRATLSFQRGKVYVLEMPLLRVCRGIACGERATCDQGQCRNEMVAVDELKPYEPGKLHVDGGLADAPADVRPALADAPVDVRPAIADAPVDVRPAIADGPPPDLSGSDRARGQTCLVAGQCASGNCVDGVCCATACAGACVACAEAKTGMPSGTCAPVKNGEDPDSECAASPANGCDTDGTCDGAGACRKHVAGTSCKPAACGGNNTLTAAATCDGLGACVDGAPSTCGAYGCTPTGCRTSCQGNADCNGAPCTDGRCGGKRANGQPCTTASECGSNVCTEGVCCGDACAGTCESCLQAKTGVASGTCAAVKAGEDPDNECVVESTACGGDGLCNGVRRCRKASAGSPCGTSCVGNAVATARCDGNGVCAADPTPAACQPYVCAASACAMSCAGDAQCAPGNYCAGTSCASKKSGGTACAADRECTSGFCTDGVCCNERCSGQCQACNRSGAAGSCGFVTGAPVGARQACAGTGDCAGTCGGASAQCTFPTSCGTATCTGGTFTGRGTCNTAGTCVASTGQACGGYACSTAGCKSTCTSASDCASGYTCSGTSCVAQPTGTWHATGSHTASSMGSNTPPTGSCANGASIGHIKSMAPNGTQIGYQHIASMDVSCSGGAFWYYKSFAVRDCSGSPQQPSTSYPAFCANPSGEVVWTAGGNAWQTIGMCIAAYTLIVEPYSCY